MPAEKEKTQRRVYVLPNELVDRITAYQQEMGLQSEVEAARKLLDEALKSRDDWRTITRRFKEKLKETRILSDIAKDVLIGHPLVNSVNFEPGQVRFTLTTGETVTISSSGEVEAGSEYGKLDLEPRKVVGRGGRELDDEIPF